MGNVEKAVSIVTGNTKGTVKVTIDEFWEQVHGLNWAPGTRAESDSKKGIVLVMSYNPKRGRLRTKLELLLGIALGVMFILCILP